MGDDIEINVTETTNIIEITPQPNDQIVDIAVTDNAPNVEINVTPSVVEINVTRGSSTAIWGSIEGNLTDQSDLVTALGLKADLIDGKVPSTQLPSYVDDVIEVANYAALPTSGEVGKIYVTLDNNKIYRWSGSLYIEIAANQAIWGAITGNLGDQLDLQNALNTKEPTITAGTTSQYWRGDKSWQTLDKNAVGLGNVDNTSDLNKPISTATQTALDLKQNIITLTTSGTTGAATLVGSTLNIPNYTTDISGLVPYTGATGNVDLGTHKLTAADLVINHASGSGVAASITKGGNGEALTVVKSTGSGNAASITGGTTLLSELHLTTSLADAYISSAATWNAKQNALNGTGFIKISGTTISYDNSTYVPTARTLTINGTAYDLSANRSWTITAGVWGQITGILSDQTDLQTALDAKTPTARTLTINGTAYDLSANRSWTIPTHDAVTIGTPANGLSLSGQVLSLGLASPTTRGALISEDYNYFFAKIQGDGNQNYIPKYTNSGLGKQIGNSSIFDNGTSVMIGTTGSTGVKVHIVETSTTQGTLLLQNTSASNNATQLQMSLRGTGKLIEGTDATSVLFSVSNGGGGYFKGLTGIGTPTPGQLLTLSQSINNTTIGLYNTNAASGNRNWTIGTNDQAYGDFAIIQSNSNGGDPVAAGTKRFYINPSGNIGIGTFAPINGGGAARWLTIDGTTNYSGGLVASINGNAKAYFYSQEGYAIVQGSTGEGVKLMPNGTNGLSIFSNGNTFIGSTPTDAGYKLDVNGTGRFSGNVTAPSFIGNLSGNADRTFAAFYNNGTTFITNYNNQPENTNQDYLIYNTTDAPRGGFGLYTVSMNKWSTSYGSMFAIDTEPGQGIGYIKTLYGGNWGGWKMIIDDSSSQAIGGSKIFLNNIGIGSTAINGNPTNDFSIFKGISISDGTSSYGSYGGFILNANTQWTASAKRFLITNILGANKFAIIRSTDAATNPSIGNNGVISSGTPDFVINDVGNVGVGSDSPRSKFEIAASLPFQNISSSLAIESATDNQQLAGINFYKHYGIGSAAAIRMLHAGATFSYANAHLAFYTNNNSNPYTSNPEERLRIFANGNVGIGTGSTDNGSKLQVNGSVRSTSGYSFDYGGGIYAVNYTYNNVLLTGYDPNAGDFVDFYTPGAGVSNATKKIRILNNGTTTFYGNVYATGFFNSSDIRLKELTDYNYNISDIKPITYIWKDGRDNKKHVGYSAQEVQKVMPDAVNEDSEGMLSVNYVEVLVAQVELLNNRMAEMQKEIELLKSK